MDQQQLISSDVGGVPSGSAMVYNMPVPIRSRTYDLYKHKQSKGLGITLIIIGILCIIFNAVSIGYTTTDYTYSQIAYIGHGIWCGVLIVSFMVMCIISATITIALLTLGVIGACLAADDCHYNYGYGYGYPYYYPPCEKMIGYTVVLSMEASMAILGFIAGTIAIWGSTLCCCSGVCCRCCTHSTPFIAHQLGYVPNGGQIVYLNQSQAGQNFYVQQSASPYYQGMMAPPYVATYAQSGWIMPPPTDSNDQLIGQAPSQYPAVLQVTSVQGQPTDQGKF